MLLHDDFTGPAGKAADTSLWRLKVTDEWQPAPELQTYTTDPANAHLDGDGHLRVRAIATGDGWTSARLESRSLFHYGQFSARIKVPAGMGTWPAFWLLGEDSRYGWPACGEVDVVEAPAAEPGRVFAGTHQLGRSGGEVGSGDLVPTARIDVDAWHTYGLDWRPGRLDFFLDGQRTGSVTRASIEALGGVWVFDDRPQRIILNLAVGGWGGTPGGWAEQAMMVDWVRVQAQTS